MEFIEPQTFWFRQVNFRPSTIRLILAIAVVQISFLHIGSPNCDAQIILDFSRSETGGVKVSGSGAGRTSGFGFSRVWRILNFDNDFVSDSIGSAGPIRADQVSGEISNSWGFRRSINDFSVVRSNSASDSIAFTTNRNMFFWTQQQYSFEIEAVFDRETLAYDDLLPGTYTSGSSIFGTTTVNISAVPEPKFMAFASGFILIAGFTLIVRKRKQTATSPCCRL